MQHNEDYVLGVLQDGGLLSRQQIDGARSRLTLEFELQGHGIGKLLAPIGNRAARKHVPNQQANMKELLESGTT